jgi:polyferredoxin
MRGHEENTVALVAFWGALCLHTALTEISIRKGVNFGIRRHLRVPRLSLTRALYLCNYFVIAIVLHVTYLTIT